MTMLRLWAVGASRLGANAIKCPTCGVGDPGSETPRPFEDSDDNDLGSLLTPLTESAEIRATSPDNYLR
jgi:hypothetical protein